MKYGLLINKMNQNLGDDIQSYAEARFLPRVDTVAHREDLDIFKYDDGTEPVAMIMGAWFMWRKFNWPPARQIIPLIVSYHTFNRRTDPFKGDAYVLPIYNQYLNGIGGQWFRDHGPAGCRDLYTCTQMDKKGIPNYFSGCVTLTLPKQKDTPDKGKYVVFVDLGEKTEERLREIIGDKYEIRTVTHWAEQRPDATWEERSALVEERLQLYQNAKYVVSSRLHACLPCLAMEVPVLMIVPRKMDDTNRLAPYEEWLHTCKQKDFEEGAAIDFDFKNGTENQTLYLETRNKLIDRITDFIKYCEENQDKPMGFFDRTSYSEEECLEWRVSFMRRSLRDAFIETRDIVNQYKEIDKELKALRKEYDCQMRMGAIKSFTTAIYRNHIKGGSLDIKSKRKANQNKKGH